MSRTYRDTTHIYRSPANQRQRRSNEALLTDILADDDMKLLPISGVNRIKSKYLTSVYDDIAIACYGEVKHQVRIDLEEI